METATIEFIRFLLGILALYLLWHVGWRPYLLDSFRARLFTLRDRLFDLAADGHISFSDDLYVDLRKMLNGTLRFAHRLSVIDSLLLRATIPNIRDNAKADRQKFLARIEAVEDEHTRQKMMEFVYMMELEVGLYFVLGNPILLIGFFLGAVSLIIRDVSKSVSKYPKDVRNRTLRRFGRAAEPQLEKASELEGSSRSRRTGLAY